MPRLRICAQQSSNNLYNYAYIHYDSGVADGTLQKIIRFADLCDCISAVFEVISDRFAVA